MPTFAASLVPGAGYRSGNRCDLAFSTRSQNLTNSEETQMYFAGRYCIYHEICSFIRTNVLRATSSAGFVCSNDSKAPLCRLRLNIILLLCNKFLQPAFLEMNKGKTFFRPDLQTFILDFLRPRGNPATSHSP